MFTQEVADRICEQLAEGLTLREVCRIEGMPRHSTVLNWLDQPELKAFVDQYAQARARGYSVLADEILEISDTKGDDPARSRLQVDSRKWLLSKMLPKVYGDKIEHEHKGSVNIIATSQDERI